MIAIKKKYEDKTLVSQAERALAADPVIDHSNIEIRSRKGIVTLVGSVRNESEHQRVLRVVRKSLDNSGLKYDRISDEIKER